MSSELLYLPNYHGHFFFKSVNQRLGLSFKTIPFLASTSNWDGRYYLYCKTGICKQQSFICILSPWVNCTYVHQLQKYVTKCTHSELSSVSGFIVAWLWKVLPKDLLVYTAGISYKCTITKQQRCELQVLWKISFITTVCTNSKDDHHLEKPGKLVCGMTSKT